MDCKDALEARWKKVKEMGNLALYPCLFVCFCRHLIVAFLSLLVLPLG
jgi:type II secretory pathway component PulF